MTKEEEKAFNDLKAENEALKKKTSKVEGLEKFNVSSDAKVDYSVEVESLESDKYHKTGDRFKVGARNAKRLAEAGKVRIIGKIAALLLFVFASFAMQAQTNGDFNVDLKSPFSLNSDTVTNTGVAYLTTAVAITGPGTVGIQVTVTEISGTTAGTITLQGSIDGTNFAALTDTTAVPNIGTKSPADVTTAQPFLWWLAQNPYRYYRVSYTGAGTMSARFSAKLIKRTN